MRADLEDLSRGPGRDGDAENVIERVGDFPVAEAASSQVLALPIYAELTKEKQARVVSAIQRFYCH